MYYINSGCVYSVEINLKIIFISFNCLLENCHWLQSLFMDLPGVYDDAKRIRIWEPLNDSQGLGTRAVSNSPGLPALPRKRVQIVL